MTIFRFDQRALARPLDLPNMESFDDDALAAAQAAIAHYAVRPNQPIAVNDDWDLHHALNEFSATVSRTERSDHTPLTYVREVEVFSRYLHQRHGKQLHEISETDLWDYRNARLGGALSVRLLPTSWNKVAAALLRLTRHLRLDLPDLRWKDFRASVEVDDRVRMISLEDYLQFRNQGMMGKRNPLRNAAFAELLVTTGVRCAEGALLLKCELPSRLKFGAYKSAKVDLPAAITKWEKRREIICSKRTITEFVAPYLEEERAHIVAQAIARLFPLTRYSVSTLEQFDDYIFFERHSASKVRIVAGEAEKVARGSDMWATFATLPDTDVEWRGALEFNENAVQEIHFLITACYIVAAYLSGMRDGEIQSIQNGARTVKRDEDGVPYRHIVRATAFKKSGVSTGKERTWVVLPEVHRALERLEELQAVMLRHKPDPEGTRYANHLFRRYGISHTKIATLHGNTTKWLNAFQDHVNGLGERASARAETQLERDIIDNLYRIPPSAEGTPWRWQAKQFRRTLAWYIANEPFGTVAGMRQYGHVREVTFQGYAGSAEAGFRDDVDLARAVGKMQDILEMYEDVRDGAKLGGPKGARLEEEFRTIAETLGDLPGKVVGDERRLLAMLKNVAKEVYTGLVNDCFFDAATALCLRKPEIKDRTKPHFASCDWEKCPNSCFWRKHRPALEDSLSEAREHRRRPGLSKNQRAALDLVIAKYAGAISKLDNAS